MTMLQTSAKVTIKKNLDSKIASFSYLSLLLTKKTAIIEICQNFILERKNMFSFFLFSSLSRWDLPSEPWS